MPSSCLRPYAPLNVLKPIAGNVWVVDGPEIRMRYFVGSMPFPTRMTVIRLRDGSLWLHSPTAWDEALSEALAEIGRVRFLVAPNRLHYWWIGDWKTRFPEARSYAAPGVRKDARERFQGFDAELLDEAPPEWGGEIAPMPLVGGYMTELEFFHRPTGTLVLTDMIENFELGRVTCRRLRALMRFGGVADPYGSTPRDLRLTFWGRRAAARRAVEEMLSWRPERVLLAHGRCYLANADAELRRAFRWLL
jgi:hypothetical protein